ncbi:PEP-CTERM sorting domain-containing protein [Haloferula sp. A504]|uniref:PEP-CTERM sorting domain-containing protein n=1 Tax=Haloferula sp. A504 TaxID=3373601 RepID=UPI0031C80F47|nr:PEP-CTERM sorting domain-containing protein [Verrucomicrobiaceae bacterium E54]
MNRLAPIVSLALTLSASAHAAVLASTDFNDSTASGNTKSNLNWSLNGINDPGNLSVSEFGGGAVNLFNGQTLTQDSFTPALNVANLNTSWTFDIPITVSSGFDVTLTDVTFNALSVSGGEAENPNRQNDFTVSLLNPSNGLVEAITIADTVAGSGSQPLVTFDFVDVALDLPGTYTLRIRGGDYTGTDTSGNHTGLDNLTINGTAIPEPSSFALLALAALAAIGRRSRP